MRKKMRNKKQNPEPYEDMVKFEKLDPYEALIKTYGLQKLIKKSVE